MTVLVRLIAAATVALCFGVIAVSLYAARSQAGDGFAAPTASPVAAEAVGRRPATPPARPATPSPTPTATAEPMRLPIPEEAPPVSRARSLGHQGLPRPLARPTPGARPRPVIVLDPGHGRGDPGAVHRGADGIVDLTEAEVNYSVAALLKGLLEGKGYDVYLTRDGWGRAFPHLSQPVIWADLFSRVGLAHAVDAQAFISIHANGSPRPEHRGVEIWYCGTHPHATENARLARLMLDAVLDALRDYGYDALDRGIQEDVEAHHTEDFGCLFLVTREAGMPAVLTELLFLTNDADAAVLKDTKAREAMAGGLAEAIDAFFRERGDVAAR